MARAMDVADFIIQESSASGRPITNLELQKYMYFCHARSLVENGSPLIENRNIEKWRYGPVVKEVYHEYKHYGVTPITSPDTHFDPAEFEIVSFDENHLNDKEKEIIQKTIPVLQGYNGFQLVNETHEHKSWKKDEELILSGEMGLEYSDRNIMKDFSKKKFRIWEY